MNRHSGIIGNVIRAYSSRKCRITSLLSRYIMGNMVLHVEQKLWVPSREFMSNSSWMLIRKETGFHVWGMLISESWPNEVGSSMPTVMRMICMEVSGSWTMRPLNVHNLPKKWTGLLRNNRPTFFQLVLRPLLISNMEVGGKEIPNENFIWRIKSFDTQNNSHQPHFNCSSSWCQP